MKIYKYIFFLFVCLCVAIGSAQKSIVKYAEKDYNDFEYVRTSEVLLKVAEKGYKSTSLFEKLGNSFYFNNKMNEASKWYGELMALGEDVDSEYYYRYAQTLKSVEQYEDADKWMRKFYEAKSGDSRGRAFISKVDYLSEIERNSNADLELHNLDINSKYSDFGTALYNGKLIFASARGKGKIHRWNEQPFLDLFTANKQESGTYGDVQHFDDVVNTKYHESTPTFTPDGKTIFFTRNNYYKGKYKSDKERTNRLKMYSGKLKSNGNWGEMASIYFNNDEYSVAHPVVNTSGTKLYFASDMPGTIGVSDLYEVVINEDGSLGKPINLGNLVNTEGNETFPFINSKGDLFFSSNGYPGLGGLDIYVVNDFEGKRERSEKIKIENIGRPINSPLDDFGYYENVETKEGFVSSNRPNGKGDDDIYSFIIPECVQTVEGIVLNKKTLGPLTESTVILFDEKGDELQRMTVGETAVFSFDLECDKEYLVRGKKETFTSDEKRFSTPKKQQELKLELMLQPDEQKIEVGDDLAKVLDIPIIYFAFDKHNIRYDAEIELQKVLAVMNEYPTMEIDIRSHTDCRGSYVYNDALSNNRAKSTKQYLMDKGIAPNRLTAKGYGEHQLVNNCACEGTVSVYCSEKDHQLNRRSEFIITSM